MRSTKIVASILGGMTFGVALLEVGCWPFSVTCQELLECCPDGTLNCLPDSGTDGGTPPECVPSENSRPVDDTCGVFVSSSKGADGAAGTKSAPLKDLRQAIDKAKGRPVYACAEAFAGSVMLTSGSAIFGGLDCTKDWAYVGATTRSALTGDADIVAMTIASTASGAMVEDFTITAANGMTAGASSIAVLVDGAMAGLTRCDLIAGDGAAGAAGADAPSMPAATGADGKQGMPACSLDMVAGGMQAKNTCGMDVSVGGQGGDGLDVNGNPGAPGQPGALGKGGDGKPTMGGGWSCAGTGAGQGGSPGAAGMPGAGAAMSELGMLTSMGFTPIPGGDGLPGKIGQGGGGGGGAKGGVAACSGQPGMGGASGGSGGAGGCGGAGGKGGQGGGASMALVSMKASLALRQVTFKTGSGGAGGKGGALQKGGAGGLAGSGGSAGAFPVNAGCKGGDGGPGGNGGPGGGGRGGHSISIAYTGTAPALDMKQITLGTAGKGGPGGNNNLSMNQGADGIAAPTQAFP